jgi:DNA repair protein RecN (Recombination protein N)
MLDELHVAGLGVIQEATLEFAPGLNVLTGETGAGKTLVTVALALTLGARSGAERLRPGETTLSAEARFSITPAGVDGRDEDPDDGEPGAWSQDGELVLARSVRADGRSSARAAGRLVPVSTLSSLGEHLVEIHGQNQAERLLRTTAQRAFLDRYAGGEHQETLGRYRAAFGALRDVRASLEALDRDARERERDKDLLAYQVREIEAAAVRPGERAELDEEQTRLAHAERILVLTAAAEDALGADGAAADGLREAGVSVEAVGALDRSVTAMAERSRALVAEAADLLADVRAYRESIAVDPARLGEVTERIHAIAALERKYGEGAEGILAYLEQARARLGSLEHGEAERDQLLHREVELAEEASALAELVGAGRSAAAEPLAGSIAAELQDLGMPGARVSVELERLEDRGPDGGEEVGFGFSAGPGQPVQPLSKVASGGELSRTMLACRSVMADLDDVPTLVFDEVDAGIGGAAAAAVGRRLADLSRRRQVIVVTHLAQIAAHADRHLLVEKVDGVATVRALSGEERSRELARMLSGTVDDVSLAHARQLILAGSGSRGG